MTKIGSGLTIGALGVVFGDIGTSPLYALRETVRAAGGVDAPHAVLGSVSLILWALIISITTIYVNIILRLDNDGEGGVLSLVALLGVHKYRRNERRSRLDLFFLGLAVLGATMLFGDAVITPAISVLSAVEGLNVALPAIDHLVVPISIGVLIGLFTMQVVGTERIGSIFGPVMLCWFAILGVLGLHGIAMEPAILAALAPRHALQALAEAPSGALIVVAAVFLAITGGEALYADLGQFGRPAIARAWYFVALPGLALTYLGQGALLLTHPEAANDPFYPLAPSVVRLPLVVFATCATIIASQAVITGIFAIVRQAGQLGLMPPLAMRQTSDSNESHVFIGLVNVLVGILAINVVWQFGSSESLADAYGLAVATAMIATSAMFMATLRMGLGWRWSRLLPLALPVVGLDILFVTANMSKFASGGWLPALLALSASFLVLVWVRGLSRVQPLGEPEPVNRFVQRVARGHTIIERDIVVLGSPGDDTPSALLRMERLFNTTFRKIIVVTVWIRSRPRVPQTERVSVKTIDDKTVRFDVSTGFMQTTNLPALLGPSFQSVGLKTDEVIYVVGRVRIGLQIGKTNAVGQILDRAFVFLTRNAQRTVDRFSLPPKRTLELGSLRVLR